QSGITLLLLARAFRTADYVGMLREVRADCPELRESLVVDDEWRSLLHGGGRVSQHELESVGSALQFDDAVNIQYTSGTTCFPQGATPSHHTLRDNGSF